MALNPNFPATQIVDGNAVPYPAGTSADPAFNKVQGIDAERAAATAAPVGVGGLVSIAAPSAYSNGQRASAWFGALGNPIIGVGGALGLAAIDTTGPGMLPGPDGTMRPLAVSPRLYNSAGPNTVPAPGDTKGAFVITKGGATIASNQVPVSTSATLVVAARAGRQKVVITSTAATVFYVGAAGVTTATGLYVAGAAGASITLDTAADVYAVGAAAVTLSYIEFFG